MDVHGRNGELESLSEGFDIYVLLVAVGKLEAPLAELVLSAEGALSYKAILTNCDVSGDGWVVRDLLCKEFILSRLNKLVGLSK